KISEPPLLLSLAAHLPGILFQRSAIRVLHNPQQIVFLLFRPTYPTCGSAEPYGPPLCFRNQPSPPHTQQPKSRGLANQPNPAFGNDGAQSHTGSAPHLPVTIGRVPAIDHPLRDKVCG